MGVHQKIRNFISSVRAVAATDLALLWHTPRLWLAACVLALVPSIYALIYLSSVWDPNAKTSELPVAIVNLDQGYDYRGRNHNVGAELTQTLLQRGGFGFRLMDDAEVARDHVKRGRLAFAIVIPRDFSATAVPGTRAGSGNVIVVLSEGNNYVAAGFARRFAVELGHQVNEALNEQRWEQVLLSADGSGRSLEMLRAGMAELRTGARAYQEGVARYSATAGQLAAGIRQLGAGVPADAELRALKSGSQRLTQGQRELRAGLEKLEAGATRLSAGATQLQEETTGIPFIGDKIGASAGELAAGGRQLAEGLAEAQEANTQLVRGTARVEEGVGRLVDGIGVLADKLPDESRLDAFARGGEELARGAARLRTGIELVDSALPASTGKLDGSARGLADSVEPVLEVQAPVANNGSAFAPNMIAMALWLGAAMAIYLFNLRILSAEHGQASSLARTAGRYLVPAGVVLVQTLLIFLVLRLVLGIAVPDYWSFTLVMLTAGQAFLGVVFLLLRTFGEVGKLFVILLLMLQLAAGGGVMPIELTADFFQIVHDWLPFTWVVKALRASLFGAYEHGWVSEWVDLVLVGLCALLLASLVRRWKLVAAADYRPGIEL